jgi:4-methylaminobutanoate oxidase (formaldehyde-forming)
MGREAIWRDGIRVGSVSSGGWGFRIEKSLGMGYVNRPDGVTRDWVESGRFEVEVALEMYPATVRLQPFYDPTGARTRC